MTESSPTTGSDAAADPAAGAVRDDPAEAAVVAALDALGADYEVIEMDPQYADTEAFCAHYGYAPEESANCIVIASRSEPVEYAACLVLATTRLDANKRVRKLMGVRKVSFASPEQTIEVTGMQIGGVTPVALPPELPLYVDARIPAIDRVIIGGGSRSMKIHLDPEVFTRMPSTAVIDALATPVE